MLDGGYMQYVTLGASHMVTGYDHLLFLFGVMFFLTSFPDVIKYITAFTIGHSITLICATFLRITADYYLIDAFIALTVCYKGFENIDGFKRYLEVNAPNLILAVFLFGLVHGFGLSTRLQQLPLGDDNVSVLGRILAFNAGVELGQLAALSIMFLVLTFWRKSARFTKLSFAANYLLILAGLGLLLMQLHGYAHNRYPDDFGFSEDNHFHSHENAEKNAEIERLVPRKENLLKLK